MNVGPELAMPAEADGALHVALHRQKNARFADPALLQFECGEAHHHFGTADHRHGIDRIKRRARDESGDRRPRARAMSLSLDQR